MPSSSALPLQDSLEPAQPWIGIGIMSGTSLDGVDACAVAITSHLNDSDPNNQNQKASPTGAPNSITAKTLATHSISIPRHLKEQLLCIQSTQTPIQNISFKQLLDLDKELGTLYAHTVKELLSKNPSLQPEAIQAIGCHGQTIAHLPSSGTLQLGDPNQISQQTGIPVISHFRQADMAAGGQGAPLVPFVDALFFANPSQLRCLVNLGGIANFTMLPTHLYQSSQAVSKLSITAYDTGPGNMLIDRAAQHFYQQPYDANGQWASQGTPQKKLIQSIASHDAFFEKKPPKSTGRDDYGEHFFKHCLSLAPTLSANDWLATFTHYTAYTLSHHIQHYQATHLPDGDTLQTIWLAGGGAENPTLIQAIREYLPHIPNIEKMPNDLTTPQYKEAFSFAILAWAYQHNIPANIPSVTGASQPCILGRLSLPPIL